MDSPKKIFFFMIIASAAPLSLALSLIISPACSAREGQDRATSVMVDQPDSGSPNRKVRVGLYENKPKIFTNETGLPSGIFVDLLNNIAQQENWELTYIPCAWSECLRALEEDRIDLMPDVAFLTERDKKYTFHEEPIMESWSQVYTRKGSAVQKWSDLNGRRLAVLGESIQQKILQQMMNGFEYQVTFVPTKSYEEAFTLVANGTVDAAVSNHLFGGYYCHEYGLDPTAMVFNPVTLYFVTHQNLNPDLLKTINRHLLSMKSESGSIYYQSLGRWMERPPRIAVPRYLIWILAIIGGILTLAFGVILLLRLQVRIRTRHLTQANETLRRSEKKYHNLFETMAQGVIYQNSEGAILSANPAAERILGLSCKEMEGLKGSDPRWHAIRADGSPFPGEEHPSMVALQTGKNVSGVIMGIFSPTMEARRWLLIDATADSSPDETDPSQVYTIFSDITEHKLAEEALRNQHRELEQVFETLPDALVYTDMERQIVRVNPAFSRIFGYEPDAVIGKKTAFFYARMEDFEELGRTRYNRDAPPSNETYEVDLRRANGEIFSGEAVGSLIRDSMGNLVGMLAMVRDITEHRKLKAQLQQAQKMESVGRLASGVAHDFNNLLSVILGYGEIMMQELRHDHPHHEPLEQILQAGQRAKDLTRQLLAFSRKQILEIHPVDVNKVVADFERLLRRVIGKDIRWELTLTSQPCQVMADTGQLEQVFMNLAVNARDAMPDGGTLAITTEVTALDQTHTAIKPEITPGNYVVISISDTGCGMDQETLDRIFEPFFTTKAKDKGTGLGLATSYGIIKQHGGSIWVDSKPKKGTTFKLYLPLCTEYDVFREKLPQRRVF